MIPLRLLPYALGGAAALVSLFLSYQWGRASAERDNHAEARETMRTTWADQVQRLGERLEYDTARAVIIDAKLASIEAALNQPVEPIYVSPPPADCPVPVVRTARLRNVAAAANAALDPVQPPPSPADTTEAVTGAAGDNER